MLLSDLIELGEEGTAVVVAHSDVPHQVADVLARVDVAPVRLEASVVRRSNV